MLKSALRYLHARLTGSYFTGYNIVLVLIASTTSGGTNSSTCSDVFQNRCSESSLIEGTGFTSFPQNSRSVSKDTFGAICINLSFRVSSDNSNVSFSVLMLVEVPWDKMSLPRDKLLVICGMHSSEFLGALIAVFVAVVDVVADLALLCLVEHCFKGLLGSAAFEPPINK